MKLLNFSQRKPVVFDGNVILFSENQVCFPFSAPEDQINEQYGDQMMPTGLSIRDMTSLDFVFSHTKIRQDESYVTFETSLPHDRSCKAVYDKNGRFLCVRLKFRCPQYLFNSKTKVSSWVDFQWTLDAKGDRLIQIDYLTRHTRFQTLYPIKKEFISITGPSVVCRTIHYDGLIVKKVETTMYEGTWIPTTETNFPVSHWKQIGEIFTQCSDPKTNKSSLRPFFVSMLLKLMLLKLKSNH